MNLNRKLIVKSLATAFATALLAQGTAHAGVDFQFSTAAITGSTAPTYTFTADEMTFTAIGTPTVTVTDTNNDGILGGADDFAEIGIQSIVNFQLNNANIAVGTTGINLDYELIVPFTFTGTAGFVGPNAVATFTTGSATIFYDEVVNNSSAGGTAIASLAFSSPNGSQCVITGPGLAEGSCGLAMEFDGSGVTDAGVWTIGGIDLGDLFAMMEINVDVDSITPPFSATYTGFGVTCGAGSGGPLCQQVVTLDQDGSAVITVPEPTSLALIGAGILGFAASRRRKA